MQIHDVFVDNRIKIGLEAEDKEELFEELVDFLVQAYKIDCRKEILQAIREREAKMSTGIMKGIALPHGKTDAIQMKGVLGVIGISKSGIDYDSLDGEPVHLVFMLVSSPDQSEQHLRVLKKLAALLENSDFYKEMIQADSSGSVIKTIKKYEEITNTQEP